MVAISHTPVSDTQLAVPAEWDDIAVATGTYDVAVTYTFTPAPGASSTSSTSTGTAAARTGVPATQELMVGALLVVAGGTAVRGCQATAPIAGQRHDPACARRVGRPRGGNAFAIGSDRTAEADTSSQSASVALTSTSSTQSVALDQFSVEGELHQVTVTVAVDASTSVDVGNLASGAKPTTVSLGVTAAAAGPGVQHADRGGHQRRHP